MVAALALSNSLTAFAAPKTMKDGTVFDADYYAKQNPDVVAVYGKDTNSLYRHYTEHGKSEGRMSHANDTSHVSKVADATFDAAYYAKQNPDVVAVYGTSASALYQHYSQHGKAEGRMSHANDRSHVSAASSSTASASSSSFDAAYYAQQNPDVVAAYGTDSGALYSHYENHGRSEGRQGHR